MVEKLFDGRPPTAESRILDPGCGRGAFVDGIIRWCSNRGLPLPAIVGVESDPEHVAYLQARFAGIGNVEIRASDFLLSSSGRFHYVIGNPPYVSITSLSDVERTQYRRDYQTASGRFDLYLLFFEQALRVLEPHGRLVFITPEKYLYVETAAPLRRLLAHSVEELHFLDEATFVGLVTYPLVTTVSNGVPSGRMRVVDRGERCRSIAAPAGQASWMPLIREASAASDGARLEDIVVRISCGVATGADPVFVVRNSAVTPGLASFAYPTIAGRNISSAALPSIERSMLVPYDAHGRLIPEAMLGELGVYLSAPSRREKLLARTCVPAKPWYSFHETPPLHDILRPKILCKDIGAEPLFAVDHEGFLIPRHSVYYIVPSSPECIDDLAAYLNSTDATAWLRDHCQRAANGFLRLQSHVLKKLPLPESLAMLAPQVDLMAGMDLRSA